jgi:ribonuclease-3
VNGGGIVKIARLQETLGVEFKDSTLLEQSLVHDSYVNENPAVAPVSNERLEFLGDAVLGLTVAQKLYHDFPAYPEGRLTHLRAALVRRDTLARTARAIRLGDYLHLGKGEEGSGGRDKDPNLAGALEAVIGAIFLDRGMREARNCTLRLLRDEYASLVNAGITTDHKSRLQEAAQANRQGTPEYAVVSASGPDHAPWFTVEVSVGASVLGRGAGKTKKAAESEAARDALTRLDAGRI